MKSEKAPRKNKPGSFDTKTPTVRDESQPVRPWWARLRNVWQRFWNDLRSQLSNDPLERCRWIEFGSTLNRTSAKPKDRLAVAGENAADRYLNEKGYSILQRNIRFPEGELDIVARDGRTLVFVEVKTRSRSGFGKPFEAVRVAKMKRQINMARRFVSFCGVQRAPIRFDIVSIVWPEDGRPEIDHLINAFRPDDLSYRER